MPQAIGKIGQNSVAPVRAQTTSSPFTRDRSTDGCGKSLAQPTQREILYARETSLEDHRLRDSPCLSGGARGAWPVTPGPTGSDCREAPLPLERTANSGRPAGLVVTSVRAAQAPRCATVVGGAGRV
jgi:hypothetical protein